MGRAPCCDKANVKRGPWSPEEDSKLKDYIDNHGTGGNWIALPQKAGLKRCGKSCRLRWLNYLRPNIKHGEFSQEEDRIICTLYLNIGSRWSIIAAQLPGRTDNDIKNYWNTKLKKKLMSNFLPSSHNHNQNQNPPITPPMSSSSMYIDYFTPASATTSSSFTSYLDPNIISLPSNDHDHAIANIATTTSPVSFPFYQNQEANMVISPNSGVYSPVQYGSNYHYNPIIGSEGSCSSSSDGSCREIKQEEIGFNHHQNQSNYMSMVGNYNNINEISTPQTQLVPLDYDIEDIKQLISVNSNNNSFMNGEDQKSMYYYY